jgi:hypothetical protein
MAIFNSFLYVYQRVTIYEGTNPQLRLRDAFATLDDPGDQSQQANLVSRNIVKIKIN